MANRGKFKRIEMVNLGLFTLLLKYIVSLVLVVVFLTTAPIEASHPNQQSETTQKRPLPVSSNELASIRNDWSREYYEEQNDGAQLRIRDESIDERLANIIHTVNKHQLFEYDGYAFNSGDRKRDLKNMQDLAGLEVNAAKCRYHLRQMVSLLDDMNTRLASKRSNQSKTLDFDERHFALARVLDSYGRFDSGYLSGRTRSIGLFDQCVSSKLYLEWERASQRATKRFQPVDTRYCWVGVDVRKHLHPSLKRSSSESSTFNRFLVAACLPKSCHSRTLIKGTINGNHDLVKKLVNSQFKLPSSLFLDENLEIGSIYCLADSSSPRSSLLLSGKLVLLFLVGWFMLTIYAASYNSAPNNQAIRNNRASSFVSKFMDCIDIRASIYDFLGSNELSSAELEKQAILNRTQRVDVSAMDPVKVIFCCFVVLLHSLLFQLSVAQNALKAYNSFLQESTSLFMVMGTIVVDTAFVITGIRLSFAHMKRSNVKTNKNQGVSLTSSPSSIKDVPKTDEKSKLVSSTTTANPIRLFLQRWLRFTLNRHLQFVPLLFIVFWFKKSIIINYPQDRPLWDPGFNRETAFGSCVEESWFSPFTMTAAYTPLNKQCLPQTWSVSTDLFFSLIIPPIMILMPRRPKLALALGVVTALASNILTTRAYQAIDTIHKDKFDNMKFEAFTGMFGNLHHLYTYPQYRLGSILFGLLAGYWLYQYDEGKFEWPNWFRGPATKIAVFGILQFSIGFISMPYWRDFVHPYESFLLSGMFRGFRIVLAAYNAILLTRLTTDWRHSFLMKTFHGQFWRSMAKLNYAILLVHSDVLIFLITGDTQVLYYSKLVLTANWAAAYFYCLPLALFMFIVYENPLCKLAKRHIVTYLDA